LKSSNDSRAHHAGVSGNIDFSIRFHGERLKNAKI
jgi:hypothetical protein